MAKNTSETISREEIGRKDDTTFKKPEQGSYQEFENSQGDKSNSCNSNGEMMQPERENDSMNLNQELRLPGSEAEVRNYYKAEEMTQPGREADSGNSNQGLGQQDRQNEARNSDQEMREQDDELTVDETPSKHGNNY